MPIYGILKKYLGEYLDLFVIILICILGYYGILNLVILKASMETLLFFYFYKIYYITFVRQWDRSRKYAFIGDFNRIFTNKFLKENKGFIYLVHIICTLMPWNLFGYILITIIVKNKLMKVWFNGNKDIFFFLYFKYDIRPLYEKYIIWYYDNIDKYIRIFIHEPFNRIIIIPTIIRNSLIHASFFSILKARMFMFIFISILVYTGINEYLHQPGYVWIIIIYIYLLLIGPRIIKIFDIEHVYINDKLVAYTTPSTIFYAFQVSSYYSVSLTGLFQFYIYLVNKNIYKEFFVLYCQMIPHGYNEFLEMDSLDDKGHLAYANNDRKFSAIMFGRYEKTYTSFICLRSLLLSDYKKAFVYYCALKNGFYGRYISKEEVEEMKGFIELYIYTYFLLFFSSMCFLNPEFKFGEEYLYLIELGKTYEKNEIFYENVVLDFYIKNEYLISSENLISEFNGFNSTKRYKRMLKYSSFFKAYNNTFGNVKEFTSGLIIYINEYDEVVLKTNKNWGELHKLIIQYKIAKGSFFTNEVMGIESIMSEHNRLVQKNNTNEILKGEDIEKLIKFK